MEKTPAEDPSVCVSIETPKGRQSLRKRKADDETTPATKRPEVKKNKISCIIKPSATKTKKQTNGGTPLRTRMAERNTKEADPENRVIMMADLKGCFEDLGKSLGDSLKTSLTKDFYRCRGIDGSKCEQE